MSTTEFVEYDIIIKAQQAMQELERLNSLTTNFNEKIVTTSQVIDTAAKAWKKSWREVLIEFQNLDRQMRTMGQQGVFGSQQGGWGATKNFMEAAEAGGRLESVVQEAAPKVDKLNQSMNNGSRAAEGFHRSLNLVRIALGTLVAVGIFQLLNFIIESFRKMTDGAKQAELALYQIGNAERALSKAGVEIAPKDFDNMIKSLKELFPYLSKIDLTRMVGSIALLTKDLGLSREQIEGLAKAIPIMAQRGQVSIESATNQVVNGLANSGRGWKDLGIVVDAAVIRQEAVASGLVASADAYNKLTAEQKQQVEVMALLSILNKSVADEQKNVTEYNKTLAGSTNELSGAWEDLLATLGKVASPFLIRGIQLITMSIQGWGFALQALLPIITRVAVGFVYLYETLVYKLDHLGESWAKAREVGMKAAKDVAESMMNAFGGLKDTPTGQKPIVAPDTTDLSKSLDDAAKVAQDYREKEDKLNRDYGLKSIREAEDHTKTMARDEQDYQIKRNRAKQDGNRAIAKKEADYRRKQIEDEAKFQEQMRQLRERYLFDLEEALRERDAKQVLRLQEKYRMDKQDAINEHALKTQTDATEHAADMAQARQEQADKLKQMDEDHRLEMQRKEEDYQIKRQREQQDHEQELADLAAQRDAKLKEIAQEIADELGIKGEGVNTIYKMLSDFYGPGGAFERLYNFANNSQLASAQQMLAQVMALYGQAQAAVQSMGAAIGRSTSAVGATTNQGGGRTDTSARGIPSGQQRSGGGGSTRHAAGGTFLATGPTQATFGEAGAELATFIPLGRSLPVNNGGIEASGGGSGRLAIELLLSPDLEGRIVANTMDATADVIMRTVRSKQ